MKIQIILLTLAAIPHLGLAADVTGTWKSEFDSQIGVQKYTYTLKQDGTNLTGKANSEVNDQKREAELKEGKVDGDKFPSSKCLTSRATTFASATPAPFRVTR